MRPPRLGKASTNASWSRSVLPLKEESADNLQFIPQETWSSSNREADGRYTGAPCMEEILQDAQEVVKLVPRKSERNSGLLRPPMPRILEETVDPLERSKILKLGPQRFRLSLAPRKLSGASFSLGRGTGQRGYGLATAPPFIFRAHHSGESAQVVRDVCARCFFLCCNKLIYTRSAPCCETRLCSTKNDGEKNQKAASMVRHEAR